MKPTHFLVFQDKSYEIALIYGPTEWGMFKYKMGSGGVRTASLNNPNVCYIEALTYKKKETRDDR